ncbi:hypothetical protein JXA02_04715 [candidate division KSB1 bacterium]|nr:hypothetical protein [candidate division KSB1 bacterium]RQW08675.1 MAG: hypothetical protein EH222_05335 [candidate division KSB1 bacterium]
MKRYALLIIPLSLLGYCSRELPQQNTVAGLMTIQKHILPEVVNPGATSFVSVLLANGTADSVRLEIFRQSETSPFASYGLFDDGGNIHPDDGDQVAYDGYFSQNILWPGEGGASIYRWRFVATDVSGQVSEPLEATVASRKNSPPVLLAVQAPDSLPSGFAGELQFVAHVSDSNGTEDIATVKYAAYQENALNFEGSLEYVSDGVYVAKMNRLFAIGKKGAYDLQFKAYDKSGGQSEIISKQVTIGNAAPQLLDFVHADSVQLPEEGKMVAFLITVRLDDDQTLADVKEVKLEWKKPDGTYSLNSPFDLYDNGLPWNDDFQGWDNGWRGDEKAGDGIYSITGIFDPAQPLGNYELTFYARDFAGNSSERITRVIALHPREGN